MSDKSVSESAPSLAAFAAARPVRATSCIVCNAPENLRRQLESLKGSDGVTYRLMGEWLMENHGYKDVTRHKLEKHWQQGHEMLPA